MGEYLAAPWCWREYLSFLGIALCRSPQVFFFHHFNSRNENGERISRSEFLLPCERLENFVEEKRNAVKLHRYLLLFPSQLFFRENDTTFLHFQDKPIVFYAVTTNHSPFPAKRWRMGTFELKKIER